VLKQSLLILDKTMECISRYDVKIMFGDELHLPDLLYSNELDVFIGY
jgi:hypothetical protein